MSQITVIAIIVTPYLLLTALVVWQNRRDAALHRRAAEDARALRDYLLGPRVSQENNVIRVNFGGRTR